MCKNSYSNSMVYNIINCEKSKYSRFQSWAFKSVLISGWLFIEVYPESSQTGSTQSAVIIQEPK